MTGRTKIRVQEIQRRAGIKRRRYEKQMLLSLSTINLFLLTGVSVLLSNVYTPGVVEVVDSYGAVLLRGGAGTYIVVGIMAFLLGVVLTAICIRCRTNRTNQKNHVGESED